MKKVSKTIPEPFHSNSRLFNCLLDALIKCGDCSSAEILYRKMTKSVESYGNLMSGFNKEINPIKTLSLFDEMTKAGMEGTITTYLCVIKALSKFGSYELCESIAERIPESFLSNNQIQTSLLDMWVCVDEIGFES